MFDSLSYTNFMSLCLMQKNIINKHKKITNKHPCFLSYTSMFPIIFCYQLMNFSQRHHSIYYLSQSIKNISNNFLSLIGFLQYSEMACSLCWCYGSLKYWSFSTMVYLWLQQLWCLNRNMIFATQRKGIFVLLRKKAF